MGVWLCWTVALRAGDRVHGVVEAHPEDLREEIDGVAGEISFRESPGGIFREVVQRPPD